MTLQPLTETMIQYGIGFYILKSVLKGIFFMIAGLADSGNRA